MDRAAIVRSKVIPRIKEDLISVSTIILSLLLLFFFYLTLHLYEKPPGSLASVAILQLINNDCLGDLDMPARILPVATFMQ